MWRHRLPNYNKSMKRKKTTEQPETAAETEDLETVASHDLLALLRGGKLEYNQEDVMNVARLYAQRKSFNDALEATGFGWLPDPDDEEKNALRDLEKWMIGALQEMDRLRGTPIKTDDECREALAEMADALSEG